MVNTSLKFLFFKSFFTVGDDPETELDVPAGEVFTVTSSAPMMFRKLSTFLPPLNR